MLSSSRLVVIKNVLVSLVTILIVALASNQLNSQELVIISTFILFFNLQNTLFEGLFGLHLLSIEFRLASFIIIKQFKYIVLASTITALLFYYYTKSFGLYDTSELQFISILSLFIFFIGIVSNSVTNVYCNQNGDAWFFLLDIVMLISAIFLVFYNSQSLSYYLLPFFMRSIGTSFIYMKSIREKRNIEENLNNKLTSGSFFASTALSVSRDSLMPLVCGLLLGPNVLVLMRIFNTIVSAPGLLANSMNKVVVRYVSHNRLNSKRALMKYRLGLSILSGGYFVVWLAGGQELVNVFFADKFNVDLYYLFISLALFCFLWPLGQLLIVSSLMKGDSSLYLKMSLIWTLAATINFIVLYLVRFEFYMLSFGGMQLINMVIYAKYYSSFKKTNC